MTEVRRAVAADAPELVRLRGVMLASMTGVEPEGQEWRRVAEEELRDRLPATDPTMAAYVVEAPDRPGCLSACAVGTVERRLAGPEAQALYASLGFHRRDEPVMRLSTRG